MTAKARYLFIVSMNVAVDKERLFNEVYDNEHVPNLLRVPGVVSVRRGMSRAFRFSVGGQIKDVPQASPRYSAYYEIEHPDVLSSDAWASAVEQGRWPSEVRPYTYDRQHVLQELLD